MANPNIIGATLAFHKLPLSEALENLSKAGFSEAEITIFPGSPTAHFAFADADEAEIDRTVDVIEKSGVRVVALNVGAGFEPDTEKQQRFERGVTNLLRLASRLGVKVVTVACGKIAEGEDRAAGLAKIADCYVRLKKTAKDDYGVTFSVEAPHKKSISESMDQIRSYWAAMPADLNCTLDVAHITFAEGSIPDVIDIVGKRIAQVHLRDAIPGNSLMDYGKGQVDFPAVHRLLDSVNYAGRCSMEFLGGETPEEAIQKLIDGRTYLTA